MLSTTKRNDSIDLMRGLAVIFVILLHIAIRIPLLQANIANHSFLQQFNNIIFNSGYYAVIIFFVISGFLITHHSLTRWGSLSAINLQQFYQLRFARIFPMLFALILILSLLDLLSITGFVIHTTTLKQAIFSALTFHINWLEAKTGYLPGAWDVLWSLSIEEVFYLFFPLLFLFFRNKYVIAGICLLLIIAGPCSRILSTNDIWADKAYLSCMDGIVFGFLAAIIINKFTCTKVITKICFILGFALFILTFILRHVTYESGLCNVGLNVTLLELSIALLLIYLQKNILSYSFWQKRFSLIFRWYGKNSYEVYLMHMLIVTLFFNLISSDVLTSMPRIIFSIVIIILLSGLVGDFAARFFSEPMNRVLRKSHTKSIEWVND